MNTDPVADMLTRIRNANMANHNSLELPYSKLKEKLAELLKSEGYILSFSTKEAGKFKVLCLDLKYTEAGEPVISGLKRISKPGLRVYKKSKDLPKVYNGLGVAVVSTSKGLLSDRKARSEKVGGEVLCYVW